MREYFYARAAMLSSRGSFRLPQVPASRLYRENIGRRCASYRGKGIEFPCGMKQRKKLQRAFHLSSRVRRSLIAPVCTATFAKSPQMARRTGFRIFVPPSLSRARARARSNTARRNGSRTSYELEPVYVDVWLNVSRIDPMGSSKVAGKSIAV